MKRALFALCVLCAAGPLRAQEGGLTPMWDIGAVLKEIGSHAERLVPLLDQADPSGWILKGAPEAYVAQWKSCKAQAAALAGDAAALAKNPETLPGALKVFFRMQSVEFSLNSLGAGVRKYQNPALADLLASVAAENGANRERFQKYIVELAAQREEEYRIMDHEAQRCRAELSRQPAQKKNGRK